MPNLFSQSIIDGQRAFQCFSSVNASDTRLGVLVTQSSCKVKKGEDGQVQHRVRPPGLPGRIWRVPRLNGDTAPEIAAGFFSVTSFTSLQVRTPLPQDVLAPPLTDDC